MFVARVAHSHYPDSARVTHAAPAGWHARLLSSAVNAFEVASLMVTQGGVNAAPLVDSLPESAQSLAQLVLRDGTATIAPLRVAHALQAGIALRPQAAKVAAPALPVDLLRRTALQRLARHVQSAEFRRKVLWGVLCAVKAWLGRHHE